jgi:hypothetical protein
LIWKTKKGGAFQSHLDYLTSYVPGNGLLGCMGIASSLRSLKWRAGFDRGIATLPATPSARSFGSPQ